MISKELLSEVLGEDRATSCNKLEMEIDNSFLVVDDWITINIYELAHKCKEWAWDKGYGFESLPFAEKIFNRFNASDLMSFGYSDEDRKDKIPYKIKYLFKACQWILNNKEY